MSRIDQRPDLQHHETAVFAERRGWEVTCTYEDCGFSGAKAGRPGLASMLADARKGKFDLVLVYRTDRLFRSLRDMVITLDDLSAIDVGFASVTEPFDTSTPSGRLLFGMVATFAEFERDVLRERTRAGVAAARARGKRLGRPTVRVDLARARLLRSTGLSYAEIANDLGVATTTLRRALAA